MHGDKVLITTGNFRFRKDTPADVVYLGLQRNQPTTLDVAKALKDTINIEKIELRALEEKNFDTPCPGNTVFGNRIFIPTAERISSQR